MEEGFDWLRNLKEEIYEVPEREYVGSISEELLRRHYYSPERVSFLNAKDFFFLVTAKVFYADMGETNPHIINYLSELLGEQTLKAESVLKEKDLELYESILKNVGLDDSHPEANRAIGDLCLFNAGMLRKHHDAEYSILMRKWFFDDSRKETFKSVLRDVGTESYKRASLFEEDGIRKEVLGKIHNNFLEYSKGLDVIAYSYVYSKVI